MHELTVISNIFNIILETAEENCLKTISGINLIIGKQRHLATDLMESAFNAVARNTIASGAVLNIKRIDIRMKCRECSNEFTVSENQYMCMQCGSGRLETLSGRDLLIESIEGER